MEFVSGLHAVKCGMCHLQFINVVLHLLRVPGDTSITQLKVKMKQNRAISKQMRSLFGIKRPEKKKKAESIPSTLIFKGWNRGVRMVTG